MTKINILMDAQHIIKKNNRIDVLNDPIRRKVLGFFYNSSSPHIVLEAEELEISKIIWIPNYPKIALQ